MMSSALFVSGPSYSFQWAVLAHMVLGIVTSFWAPDVSIAIASLGFVALHISNLQLLWLYVAFAPLTAFLDIAQMVHVHKHHGTEWFALFVFLRLLEMLAKLGGGYFGYQIFNSTSAAEAGYQTMPDPGPRAEHFPAPPSYSAPPQPQSGPQVNSGTVGISPGT